MIDPRNAQPGSYRTSGHGAESREANPGGSIVRESQRPAKPAGRGKSGGLVPAAGRGSGPPGPAQGASPLGWHLRSVETRPTSMYRVPWQSARADRRRRAVRRPQPPAARPHRTAPDDDSASPRTPPDFRAGTPDTRWPSLTRLGPLHIPVVGPTEALRGRPGGPGMDGPPGAVPGLLDHERQSGWQLAQRVWQDSGVNWEDRRRAHAGLPGDPVPVSPRQPATPEEDRRLPGRDLVPARQYPADDDHPDDDLSPRPPSSRPPPPSRRAGT